MKANKRIRNEAGVSAVVGVILMVAITVAISATVYVYANNLLGDIAGTQTIVPNLSFMKSYRCLTVVKTGQGLDWSMLSYNITGNNTIPIFPTGEIKAGQSITNLTGKFSLIFENQLIGIWEFL